MSALAKIGLGMTALVVGATLLLPYPCCSTHVEARKRQVSRELTRIRAAQQGFYKHYHRYAASLAELELEQKDSFVVLQFATQGPSVLVSGSYKYEPKVTCLMQATPGVKITRSFICTHQNRP